jgi:hypothetical protein
MRQWQCRCATDNIHDETLQLCQLCETRRPYELDPLPVDQHTRFVSLVDWLDGQLARRPRLLGTTQGLGLTQLVNVAKRDPAGTYRTVTAALKALNATRAWVEDGEAAPPDAFDLLGPEG